MKVVDKTLLILFILFSLLTFVNNSRINLSKIVHRNEEEDKSHLRSLEASDSDPADEEPEPPANDTDKGAFEVKRSSSGMSTGAICGIAIPCIAALLGVAGAAALLKGGAAAPMVTAPTIPPPTYINSEATVANMIPPQESTVVQPPPQPPQVVEPVQQIVRPQYPVNQVQKPVINQAFTPVQQVQPVKMVPVQQVQVVPQPQVQMVPVQQYQMVQMVPQQQVIPQVQTVPVNQVMPIQAAEEVVPQITEVTQVPSVVNEIEIPQVGTEIVSEVPQMGGEIISEIPGELSTQSLNPQTIPGVINQPTQVLPVKVLPTIHQGTTNAQGLDFSLNNLI